MIVHVLEVPLDMPIDADLPEAEDEADDLLDEARALVESYGVRVVERARPRARSAGREDRRGGGSARTPTS